MVLHMSKLESPLPKDALCQVWLKLTHWFWRRRLICEMYVVGQTDKILKIFFSRTTEPISIKFVTKHPWVKGIQVCSNEELINSHKINNVLVVNLIFLCLRLFIARDFCSGE